MTPHAIAAKKLKLWLKFADNLAKVFVTPHSHCGDGCLRTLTTCFRGRFADTTPPWGCTPAALVHCACSNPLWRNVDKEPWFGHFTGNSTQSIMPISIDRCKIPLVLEYIN